jgi:hypothetical protein
VRVEPDRLGRRFVGALPGAARTAKS